MSPILKLMRLHQYIKNFFVFAPMLFSFQFSLEIFFEVTLIFLLFSLLASSIYIFNDLMDINEDKKHPSKKFRPLASGTVSTKTAYTLIFLFSLLSLGGAFFLNQELFFILSIYFFLNLAYSLKLKHIPLIDIFIIAVGFVLRLGAGNSALDAPLSMWIVIMTFLLALFLALAKRRDDVLLASQGKETRKNIDGYNLEFINATMVLMSAVIVVSYILYCVSPEVTLRLHTRYLYITSFFVILGILRYMQITFVEEKSGSPTKVLLKDKFLQATILLWITSFYFIVKGV
ncbi:MAG: prenyltransferase UbiA [Sulfurovum sp. PC08-66]|nr:MAG: prenyltransferase UbiA [Sulfurovum sp. PC08-66]KIM12636.1 MAG: prenyltransferase UbiA [Sulfuricurvum sp. PC08-66]